MEIKQMLCTQSDCYKANRKIQPKGGMLHSVGCPQPKAEVFHRNWNKPGVKACTHAVMGPDGVVLQLLPWDHRAWHCASGPNGSGNNDLISLEMTEPATIKYVGGSQWIELGDGSNTKAHVLSTYKEAVKYFAKMAVEHGFDPLTDGCMISHQEGYQRGIASNHGDVEHIWKHFGLTMNQFRRDVKNAMAGVDVDFGGQVAEIDTANQKVNELHGTVTVIYDGDDGLNIRTAPSFGDKYVKEVVYKGTYTVTGISEDEKWYRLASGLFITAVPDYVKFKATPEQKEETGGTGYYRVRKTWTDENSQIGAFKSKDNAIQMCKANSGYIVFDNDGNQIYPEVKQTSVPYVVKVKVTDLRIRKGPGTTYDYYKDKGKARHTGTGAFTIVKEAEGPGADKWGLLKYYAEHGIEGWISLDDEFVDIVQK